MSKNTMHDSTATASRPGTGNTPAPAALRKSLKNRHVQLIALGGAIGTGLFYGSSESIALAGPSILLAYLVGGLAIFMIVRALGEMSVEDPRAGAFSYYATRYWSKRAGFVSGWNYWFNYILVSMVELSVVGSFVNYWFPAIPQWVSAAVFLVVIAAMNLLGVSKFGEFEFWFAIIKIVAVIAMIVGGLAVLIAGLPTDSGVKASFSNWFALDGGVLPHGLLQQSADGQWTGLLMALVVVMFSFGGTELIGITAGETEDPRRTIPRATNGIIWRILVFYIGALGVIMAVVPWNTIDGTTSPFVQIFDSVGVHAAAGILNFVCLTAVMSVYNSGLYANSRMLYSLARQGNAPEILGKLNFHGVPVVGVLASAAITALAVVGAALQNAALLFDAKNFDPEAVTLFAPVAALLLCGNALGKWLQIRAVCANFALASSGEEHAAAFLLEKEQLAKRLCDGLGEPEPRLLLNRPTALVKGFLRQSFSPRAADAMVQKLCWGLGGAALVCAVVAGVKGGGVISALSGLAAALSLSAPLAATLVYALPTSLMQQATSRCGAVVPGPSAVETLGSANTVLLSARELFPAGSVRLHGIKTFEKERIDIAILYAASLLSPSCETLRGVFMGMLDNNEKLLAGVENASVEIGYGFTGWIEHRRVLLGSREMMKRHDIEVPSLDYEKKYTKNGQRSPIYLAVAGKLFGMFLVSYRPDRRAAETLDSLAQSGISVLVQADDFNITAPLVAATYGIPEGTVKVLSQHEQDALETELAYRPESEGVMMHTGACASFLGGMRAAARAAAGERLAGVVQTAAVTLGAVLSVALGFYEGLTGLSLGTVLAYQLVWCAIIASVPFAKKP